MAVKLPDTRADTGSSLDGEDMAVVQVIQDMGIDDMGGLLTTAGFDPAVCMQMESMSRAYCQYVESEEIILIGTQIRIGPQRLLIAITTDLAPQKVEPTMNSTNSLLS